MKTPTYALVCGTLRLEFEFFTTLTCLCELRKHGVIDEIVVSAWDCEEENIPGIHEKLSKLNIALVESHEPTLEFHYGESIYLRQAVQLSAGLDIIPANTYVIKCRTDYSNFDLNRMDVFSGVPVNWTLGKHGEFRTGKEARTAVLRFGIGAPFSFHDICFMGKREDLKKMVLFENTSLSFNKNIIADIWFFAGYYAIRFPLIRDFLKYVKVTEFHRGINNLRVFDEEFILPDFLCKFFALYFIIIYTDYAIYHDMYLPKDTLLRIEDIFYGNSTCGIRKDWVVEIRCFDVIRKIVEGELEQSRGYVSLYAEINKMKNMAYVEELKYCASYVEEMAEWGRKYLGYEPEEWLEDYRELSRESFSLGKEIGFEESATILFSDYHMNESTYAAVRDIAFNKQSYYNTVISHLCKLKEVDEKLYKKALFSSTRYFDDSVLRKVAELLMGGKALGKDATEASFIFKRFAHDERLYQFPMTVDRVFALIYYITYQEKMEGTSDVADELLQRLRIYYDIKIEEINLRQILIEITELDIDNSCIDYEDKIETQSSIRAVLKNEGWF